MGKLFFLWTCRGEKIGSNNGENQKMLKLSEVEVLRYLYLFGAPKNLVPQQDTPRGSAKAAAK